MKNLMTPQDAAKCNTASFCSIVHALRKGLPTDAVIVQYAEHELVSAGTHSEAVFVCRTNTPEQKMLGVYFESALENFTRQSVDLEPVPDEPLMSPQEAAQYKTASFNAKAHDYQKSLPAAPVHIKYWHHAWNHEFARHEALFLCHATPAKTLDEFDFLGAWFQGALERFGR
jgi:hypothetical protein